MNETSLGLMDKGQMNEGLELIDLKPEDMSEAERGSTLPKRYTMLHYLKLSLSTANLVLSWHATCPHCGWQLNSCVSAVFVGFSSSTEVGNIVNSRG
ncbi:hypothetical protein FCV25MIE_01935 [Fagus crenata]